MPTDKLPPQHVNSYKSICKAFPVHCLVLKTPPVNFLKTEEKEQSAVLAKDSVL